MTHASAVTALGDTLEATWKGLLEGRTAIRPVRRFSTAPYPTQLAACMEDLSPETSGSRIHGLMDKALRGFPPIPQDTLLFTATTKGAIDLMGKTGPAPGIETALVPNLAQNLSRNLGLKKAGVNISAACASSTVAVAQACTCVTSGRVDSVLVVGADLVTEFVFSGFSSLQILSPRPCTPFDVNRSGLSLGEGAAAVLLMSPERAVSAGFSPVAAIHGWGVAGDADHITSPSRDGQGLVRAIRRALAVADLAPEAISGVNAHGTGTFHNDRMELAAFHTVFGNRALPIHSIKGAVGHTLGAAGGIELAVSVRSLREGWIPPTLGAVNPEFSGKGRVFTEPVPLAPGHILSTNSGFGGVNAALILGKGNVP